MISLSRRGLLGSLALAAGGRMTDPYVRRTTIGSRQGFGVPDSAAQAGNVNPYLPGTGWDVIFQPQDLASNWTEVEIYQIYLDGPPTSQVAILIDGNLWNTCNGWNNSFDQVAPLLLSQTSSLAFCWNFIATPGPYDHVQNIQPVVTIWMRLPQRAMSS